MTSLLIYSKNTLYRECLVKIVAKNNSVTDVFEVDDSSRILSVIIDKAPDYILLDIFSRNVDDNVLTPIKGKYDSSRIIILTTKENNILNYFSYYYGIKNYVFADEDVESIEKRINDNISGASNGFDNMSPFALTSRECEILQHIANGNTSKEIAETLCISKNTVDTHRNKMLQKLNLSNSPSLVKYAYKYGLI